MIYVDVHGRLGNQLFQYAFARWLQVKTGDDLTFGFQNVISSGIPEEGWNNSLSYFNTVNFIVDHSKHSLLKSKSTILQKTVGLVYILSFCKYRNNYDMDKRRIIQMKWQPILNCIGLYWLVTGYRKPIVSRSRVKLVNGQFESKHYFDDIREQLLEEITPKAPPMEHNRELYRLIQNSNSVCISVRRGDYETKNDNKKVFSICSEKYYIKAVEYMANHVDNPKFIFFSDDIEWVKNNIHIDYECFYESGFDPVWEKLRLMYSCKHFIIANSTFSWWAQYLGRYQYKIVVSPDRWFKTSAYNDLIDESFIIIGTEEE